MTTPSNLNVIEHPDGRLEVARLSEDELRQLAGRVVRDEIFLGTDSETLQGFLVLSLGAILPDGTGLVWEELSKRGAHYVNGMPMFLSIGGFVHVEDTPLFVRTIREMWRATGVNIPSEEELEKAWKAKADGNENAVRELLEQHYG